VAHIRRQKRLKLYIWGAAKSQINKKTKRGKGKIQQRKKGEATGSQPRVVETIGHANLKKKVGQYRNAQCHSNGARWKTRKGGETVKGKQP